MPTAASPSPNQVRQRRMARAVARNHGRTVYLRPPASGAVAFAANQPARRAAPTTQHACVASVADDGVAASGAPGGASVDRAERVYEVQAASLPAGVAPQRGWSLFDPHLASDPSTQGALEITAVEAGADGAVLRVSTRRGR